MAVEIAADVELDTKGLVCPLPVVKCKLAMDGMDAGQVLHIEATDPGSLKDFPAWCEMTGNELLAQEERGGVFHFWIRKKA